MPSKLPRRVDTKADKSNRLDLGKDLSQAVPWLSAPDVRAWLFVVAPGRYRLLSDEQVENDLRLEPVRQLIVEGPSAARSEATGAYDLEEAALAARLLPLEAISSRKTGLRITLPKLRAFVPPQCDPKRFSIFFSLEGYLEIWHTDLLQRVTVPLENN